MVPNFRKLQDLVCSFIKARGARNFPEQCPPNEVLTKAGTKHAPIEKAMKVEEILLGSVIVFWALQVVRGNRQAADP